MNCSELMKRNVECCRLEDSVASAAARMRARNVGFLPVCDEFGRAVGTITDRDLVVRVLAEQRSASSTIVGDVMTHRVIACSPSDELEIATRHMREHKVSRILCVDEGSRPVGVISLSDIAEVETASHAAEVMRSVSEREAAVS
jgi:CBS domain-containing protein